MSITKAELKQVKALTTKKARKASGRFLAEGVRLLEEAARFRFWPDRVYYAESLLSERGVKLVDGLKKSKIACRDIPARDIRTISGTKTPQGIIGVFEIPSAGPAELYRSKYRRVLWCENVSDPGNLGTLLRSALAFDFKMVVVTGDCADVYSPKVVRSSAGAVFGLTVAVTGNKEVISLAQDHNIDIIATGVGGKKSDYSLKKVFKRPKLILAIGSEADGLSSSILQKAGMTVSIAHTGRVDSLNAAVAGSILMERIYSNSEV